jgi:hypothetical protein
MLRAATQGILGEIAPITGVVRHSKFSATTAAMGHSLPSDSTPVLADVRYAPKAEAKSKNLAYARCRR